MSFPACTAPCRASSCFSIASTNRDFDAYQPTWIEVPWVVLGQPPADSPNADGPDASSERARIEGANAAIRIRTLQQTATGSALFLLRNPAPGPRLHKPRRP